ncbi:MAG: hypothetical protein HY909_03245 [Deltaproteobacteria bacterium]|nr:hypothetical protein [Deltaproteobacteria bacterium]
MWLRRGLVACLLPGLCLGQGCLSNSYRIPPDELLRIASLPPNQRGVHVRAVQTIAHRDTPPPNVTYLPQGWALQPLFQLQYGTGMNSVGWSPRPRGVTGVGGGSGGGSGGSGGGSGGGGGGSGNAAAIAVVVVAGVLLVFVLAGTEGARYDGWVGLPPNEMLFLEGPEGTVAVPMNELTPALASRTYTATVYEGSTARYELRGRAPLNRVGFTFQGGVGLSTVPDRTGTAVEAGLGGRVFLGGYPVQQLGLGLTFNAAGNGNLVASVGGEVQVMPLTYLGMYAGFAAAFTTQPDRGRSGTVVQAGVQVEAPLTTRLTFQVRAGGAYLDVGLPGGAFLQGEATAGMAVY